MTQQTMSKYAVLTQAIQTLYADVMFMFETESGRGWHLQPGHIKAATVEAHWLESVADYGETVIIETSYGTSYRVLGNLDNWFMRGEDLND